MLPLHRPYLNLSDIIHIIKKTFHLLILRDSFIKTLKVTCRDNGKDDPPWKEWTKDGSAAIETTFTSLCSLLLLLF